MKSELHHFSQVMKDDSHFKTSISKLDKHFFDRQTHDQHAHQQKHYLQRLLLAEPHAPRPFEKADAAVDVAKDTPQRKVITKLLQELLLEDFYTTFKHFERDFEPPAAHKQVQEL